MKPEDQLIILSAHLHFDDETARRFESILSGTPNPSPITSNPDSKAHPKPKTQNPKLLLDCTYILKTAHRLSIAPLLHKHLSNPQFRDKVPAHVLKALKDEYRKQAFRSLRIQAQIHQLLDEAQKRQIPVILLKGAALANWLYQDIALRPMGDIDILCKDEDIPRIKQMLSEIGYYQDEVVYQSRFVEEISVEWGHLPRFHLKNGFPVEVHKNVFGKYAQGDSKKQLLWETATKVEADSRPFYRLSNECLLLHLFLHLYSHMLNGNIPFYWVTDILELNRKTCKDLNWNLFWSLADDLGAQDDVAHVMATLNAHYALSLPSSGPAVRNMKPISLPSLMNTETSKKVGQSHFLSARMRYVKKIYLEHGLARAGYVILRILFPSTGQMENRYPAAPGNSINPFSPEALSKKTRNSMTGTLKTQNPKLKTAACRTSCYASHFHERCRRVLRSAFVKLLN